MPQDTAFPAGPASEPWPVRIIDADDLRASLVDGYADFKEKRGDLIFVGLLYPLIGLVAAMLFNGAQIFLLFPIFAGLSLMGPLVATGFYEIARRRELGLDASWRHFFDVVRGPSALSIMAVGAGLLAIFCAWLASAAIVYGLFFGTAPPDSAGAFLTDVFFTGRGWAMIAVGNLIGLVFALVVLAASVVSLPLLVDRKVSAERAVATSLSAFRHNPGILLRWGLIVAVILVLGAIPLLIGLAVALPVLGYATWHLYTRLVDREAIARMGR
jgi:uncharacterized membrane protein